MLMTDTTNTETTNEDVSGLKSKVNELLAKLKAADKRAADAEAKAQETAESAENANRSELEKAIKRAEKAEKAAADLEARSAELQQSIRNKNADSAISKLLSSANVDAADAKLLNKALRADVEFNDDGEPLIAGKSVEDFGKEFFGQKGDGYRYVRAANNSGGGATGGSTAGPTEPFNETEYGQLWKTDPIAANAWAQATNNAWIIPKGQ